MRAACKFLLVFCAITVWTTSARADIDRWVGEGWKTDFSKMSVPVHEVLSGGPPRDGIPSIDNPKFRPLSEITDIPGREPVIWLEVNGDVRAYPLRVLTWHEIVNDTIGGVPAAITYCPLCNASIVFDRRVDGQTLEFGTTGKLRNSDLIMYDRQSDSWWQQFSGASIAGSFLGTKLKLIPSRVTSMEAFSKAHPNGQVLVPNNPRIRDYGRNPYAGYDSSSTPFLYRGDMPDNIPPMARVVVVRTGDVPIVVSLERVRKAVFEKNGYTVSWTEGVASALDRAKISDGKDVGAVRVMKDGRDVVHDVTFAFVAHAFHPETPIVTE